jgi:hypothetical protein
LLSTHPAQTPEQRLTWFVRRWTMEGTCEEARAPLGMETQRQWNERAIARATPALLSLYALITLTAQQWLQKGGASDRPSAGYAQAWPTFSDASALVRRQVWDHMHFSMSQQDTDRIQIPRVLLERLIDAVCYAASLDKVHLRWKWTGRPVR